MKITKVIIPAAGLGTRFLPFTKSVPKELLPIMETPALQLIIEEGLQSNIYEFEIIANQNKHAINEYFSENKELNELLKKTNKLSFIDSLNKIIEQATFNYIPQPKPLGLGHAILMAQHTINNNEYFGILLPDEIMLGKIPALAQLISIAQKYNSSVIAIQEVPMSHVSSYGIIAIKKQIAENLFEIDSLIEKPTIDQSPSNLAIIGRYILSPQLFESLQTIKPGAHNEIQLTDGITDMMKKEKVLAYKINTVRHDIGNPLGWLQANIDYALANPTHGPIIKNYIQKLISHI